MPYVVHAICSVYHMWCMPYVVNAICGVFGCLASFLNQTVNRLHDWLCKTNHFKIKNKNQWHLRTTWFGPQWEYVRQTDRTIGMNLITYLHSGNDDMVEYILDASTRMNAKQLWLTGASCSVTVWPTYSILELQLHSFWVYKIIYKNK